MRLLLVEDSEKLSAWLAKALQQGGYATDPRYANKLSAVAQTLKSPSILPITVSDFS